MIAHEFDAVVTADGKLSIPPDVVPRLPAGEKVRVLLLVEEPNEEEDWHRLMTEQFLKGYSEGDALYDQLPAG